ncbi:MAG TPA: type II CAAX endopeptidase family protein [Ruminiclostridium sp.]
MVNKRKFISIIAIVIAGCLIMAWVDAIIRPDYAVKSIVKIVLFALLPIGYSIVDRQISLRQLLSFNKNSIKVAVCLGVGVYIFILGAYFILVPYFDFSKVTVALQNNIGVNKDNFVFVAIYISFINSLLEEFFFRGISFLTLKRVASRKVAYIFSAAAFAFYHVAILTSWFSLALFLILIVSLFAAGLIFNWLDEKNENIYVSWTVHMCANFAINTIGFMLFGIL